MNEVWHANGWTEFWVATDAIIGVAHHSAPSSWWDPLTVLHALAPSVSAARLCQSITDEPRAEKEKKGQKVTRSPATTSAATALVQRLLRQRLRPRLLFQALRDCTMPKRIRVGDDGFMVRVMYNDGKDETNQWVWMGLAALEALTSLKRDQVQVRAIRQFAFNRILRRHTQLHSLYRAKLWEVWRKTLGATWRLLLSTSPKLQATLKHMRGRGVKREREQDMERRTTVSKGITSTSWSPSQAVSKRQRLTLAPSAVRKLAWGSFPITLQHPRRQVPCRHIHMRPAPRMPPTRRKRVSATCTTQALIE